MVAFLLAQTPCLFNAIAKTLSSVETAKNVPFCAGRMRLTTPYYDMTLKEALAANLRQSARGIKEWMDQDKFLTIAATKII